MSDPTTPPSRDALRDFLALIGQVDREFLGPDRNVTAPADVAAGEHMLLHLIKCGLDTWVDNDASRPRFAPLASAVLKWGGEGADNPSHCAPLDPTRRYRITGRMHDEAYISFTVYTGKQEGDFNDGIVSALNHTQFPRDAAGRFSIEISPTPSTGALHMQSGKANCVIARHYFERETCAMADPRLLCEIDIECLDEPGYPRPLAPAALADKLRAAMTFIESQTLARKPPNPASAPSWFSMVPNQLPKPEKWVPTEGGGAGAIDNAYCAGLVVLQPDQALVVEARWPKCVYANVMFWNRCPPTGDYRYRSGSLNRNQMKSDAEGRFSFVVSPKNPGRNFANWIDTEGQTFGSLYWRFLLPEGDIEKPVTRLVPLSELSRS